MKGSETMKTELTMVSPKLARDWLRKNTSNRPLRPGVVDGFMRAYEHGEWKVTHQGIAFGKNGVLLDGQHRLTFISQLPEGSQVPVNVSLGVDALAFDAIDLGFKRTMSDVYGVSGECAAVARFFAKIYNSNSNAGLTNQFVKPFIDWVMPEYEELLTFCPANVKVWSSAAFKSAAICQMKRGHDPDFVKLAYYAMVHADVDAMPFAGRLLIQQYVSGKIVANRSMDLFARGLRVFDSKNNVKMVRLRVDATEVAADTRKWLDAEMKKSPTKAGLKVAKPSNNFNWNKAA